MRHGIRARDIAIPRIGHGKVQRLLPHHRFQHPTIPHYAVDVVLRFVILRVFRIRGRDDDQVEYQVARSLPRSRRSIGTGGIVRSVRRHLRIDDIDAPDRTHTFSIESTLLDDRSTVPDRRTMQVHHAQRVQRIDMVHATHIARHYQRRDGILQRHIVRTEIHQSTVRRIEPE